MAAGVATFTPSANSAGQSKYGVTSDGKRFVEGSLVLSSSYATDGDTLALTGGLSAVERIEVVGDNTSGLSFALGGTATAPKIKAYDADATEVTAATDLSTRQATRLRVIGH